ncbi:MAG: hypothetical protein RRC34_16265 [Lentisphaeria bacterium]|nr:hypothetical protein [Lentisphaeria bacterium]
MSSVHFPRVSVSQFIFAALVLFSSAVAPASAGAVPRGQIVVFGTDCDECRELKKLWPDISKGQPHAQLTMVDVDNENGYMFLLALEKELKVRQAGDLPVALIGGKLIYGGKAIKKIWNKGLFNAVDSKRAAPSILTHLLRITKGTSGIVSYTPPSELVAGSHVFSDDSSELKQSDLIMAVLTLEGCKNCSRQELVLRNLKNELPKLTVDRFSMRAAEGRGFVELMRETFNITAKDLGKPPVLVWPDAWGGGKLFSRDDIIAKLKASSAKPFWREISPQELEKIGRASTKKAFDVFTVGVVVAGGLIDGINPCAFAVVVFLVSYLACIGRKRKAVAVMGSSFCSGVFIAYFLIGLGLSAVLAFIQEMVWVRTVLYGGLGLVALWFAGVHLRDAVIYKKTGKAKDLSGKLSPDTTLQIHEWVRKLSATSLLIPAGLALGCVVSLLELACTGQIYLPILSIINRDGINVKALFFLSVYCLAFILPLAIVTFLAAYGIGARAIGNWGKKNLVKTKLAMTGLFLALAGITLEMAWRAFQMRNG